MRKAFFITGTVFGMLAVAFGAFGAHALKDILVELGTVETFKTASLYHLTHALLLTFTGYVYSQGMKPTLRWVNLSLIAGIIIFSGSLYILAITGIKILGAITPLGGVFLIIAWCLLLRHALKEI